jgi:hypothetical protein
MQADEPIFHMSFLIFHWFHLRSTWEQRNKNGRMTNEN